MTCTAEAVIAPGHNYGGRFAISTSIDLSGDQIVCNISLCTGINVCPRDGLPAFGVLLYDALQVRFLALKRELPYLHKYLRGNDNKAKEYSKKRVFSQPHVRSPSWVLPERI